MKRTLLLVLSSFLAASPLLRSQEGPAEIDFEAIKRGRWKQTKDIPEGFERLRVGRYELQTNCDAELADKVGRHLNAMFKTFYAFSPPKKTPKGGLVVKLFRDRKQFVGYGRTPGAAAYFSPSDKEMVGYDTGLVGGVMTQGDATTDRSAFERWRDRNAMDLLGVFGHEGWHQYFHWTCGSQVDFPAWCDEGIAEYFYAAWVGDDDEMITGAPNEVRLEVAQELLERGRHTHLSEFVFWNQAQYYRNPGASYAQGWSFVHFLLEHPEYRKRRWVERFVKIFIDVHSIEETVPRVFGKKPDWDRIEADWKAWVLAIPRRVDPLDPFAKRHLDFNAAADARRAELPEKVREALDACLARRAPAPWESGAKTAKPD